MNAIGGGSLSLHCISWVSLLAKWVADCVNGGAGVSLHLFIASGGLLCLLNGSQHAWMVGGSLSLRHISRVALLAKWGADCMHGGSSSLHCMVAGSLGQLSK